MVFTVQLLIALSMTVLRRLFGTMDHRMSRIMVLQWWNQGDQGKEYYGLVYVYVYLTFAW